MREVSGSRRVPVPPEVAFARLAAFESAAIWDPGVSSARRLTAGPPGPGTQYAIEARFLGRRIPMTYTLVAMEPDRSLHLVGEADASLATDRITTRPLPDGGSEIHWTLQLQLRGLGRLAEPALGPVLRRLARRVLDGLAQDLSGTTGA